MYNQKSYAALLFDDIEEYQELESRLIFELQNEGNNIHLLNNLGLIQLESGDIKKAENYFKESAALGNTQALETLCDLYAKTNRVKEALDTIYTLIELENEPYQIGVYHRTAARCHANSNDLESAMSEYQKSLIADPDLKIRICLWLSAWKIMGKVKKGVNLGLSMVTQKNSSKVLHLTSWSTLRFRVASPLYPKTTLQPKRN